MRHRRHGRALRRRYGRAVVPGTSVEFGHEKTRADCLARAAWEREQAADLRDKPYGDIIAGMHLDTARAYEQLAERK